MNLKFKTPNTYTAGAYEIPYPGPVSLLLVVCGDTELSALGEQAFLNAPKFWRVTTNPRKPTRKGVF